MNKRIFVMIDNDPNSVGSGWAATPAEVTAAFVDFVEANVTEMYPDHDVTVVSGPRTSVEADTPDLTADLESSLRWFWTVFVENEHEGYDLVLFARNAPEVTGKPAPGGSGR